MYNNKLLCIIVFNILKSWMDPAPEAIDLSEGITLSKDQLKGNDERYMIINLFK